MSSSTVSTCRDNAGVAEVEDSAGCSRPSQVGGEFGSGFLELTRKLMLGLRHLSGNRLAEESPAGTPGVAGEGFEIFYDPVNLGEKTG